MLFLGLSLDYIAKKRGQFTSSTFTRYRQTPYSHIRVKAHASSVSILAFTLDCSLILANSVNKIQADASVPICPYYIYLIP